MTSQILLMLQGPDTKWTLRSAMWGTCAAAIIVLGACSEEEAQQTAPVVQAPPPPPPPPPEPTVEDIASLMKSLSIDERVSLPEELAPKTTEERKAVLLFWNAFAKGDDAAAGRMMSERDAKVLKKLTEGGGWAKSTTGIKSIEVQCKNDSNGFATFAIITSDLPDRALLWDAGDEDGKILFTSFPGPPDILDHLSGTDSIAAWKKYVNDMFEKYANLPDEEVEIPQSKVEEDEQSSDGGGGGGGSTPTPPSGTGGGALKKQKRPPIPD
jgi:hypothetical protein